MLSVPRDILKQCIFIHLDKKDRRSLWSTCKKLYSLYSPYERVNYAPVINGKRKCGKCGMFIFEGRYKSHCTRCILPDINAKILEKYRPSKFARPMPENVTTKDVDIYLEKYGCELCGSLHFNPQKINRKNDIEHPYIKCNDCGKGITKNSRGCLNCGFWCLMISCFYCQQDYLECSKHICLTPLEQWIVFLRAQNMYFGFYYDKFSVKIHSNYIVAFGRDGVIIHWYLVNRKTYKECLDFNYGSGIHFIVNEDTSQFELLDVKIIE